MKHGASIETRPLSLLKLGFMDVSHLHYKRDYHLGFKLK